MTLTNQVFQLVGFHDCVSGCDGCINLDNSANNGLSTAIDAMEDVYTEITEAGISVSRADLWAIAGRAGAEFGMENMPGNSGWVRGVNSMNDFVTPFATFKYGRVDCETAPYTTEEFEFPEPHMTYDKVMDFFAGCKTFHSEVNNSQQLLKIILKRHLCKGLAFKF